MVSQQEYHLQETASFAPFKRCCPCAAFLFYVIAAERLEDPDGVDLPEINAARDYAIAGARPILAAEIVGGRLPLNERIEVTDESGASLLTVAFRDTFQVVE